MSLQRPNIEKMHGYLPGEQPDDASTIKLNTNENPYPASPAVQEALAHIDAADLRRYPPPLASAFRDTAAALHGIHSDNIIPTNGGDELLRLALTTFADMGDSIMLMQPSYSLYPVLADIAGCTLEEVPLTDSWEMPADFLSTCAASKARMLMLVNPHAPTGQLLSADYLAQVAEAFNGVLLIDEAYVDFVHPDNNYNAIELIADHENVLILRTLSKGYSLAGLRFGYGIGARSLIEPMLYKTRDSYNTDYIAQKLATAALESVDYARDTWAKVRESRQRMFEALNELGFDTLSSQTNFLLARVPVGHTAEDLYTELKARKILVRHFNLPRLEDCLRITIGTPEENTRLLQAITEILA